MRINWYITAMRVPLTFWLFVAVGVGMLVAGIVLLINQHELGYGLGAFGLFWCFLIWVNTLPSLTKYGISGKGIHLKKWWLKKFIPWEDVKGIGAASEHQGEFILQAMNDKAREIAIQKGLLEVWHKRKEFTSINSYLGVPVVYSEQKGPFMKTKRKADINGSVILINTISGNSYLISPKHLNAFLEECYNYLE